MRRKVLRDFANVCCQMFLTSLSNSDRINFVIFGGGQVSMDFLSLRCMRDRAGISPLGYCVRFRGWLAENCLKHNIKFEDLSEARLDVQMEVQAERREKSWFGGWLTTNISFDCECRIATDEKLYFSHMSQSQRMGLGQILHDHYY